VVTNKNYKYCGRHTERERVNHSKLLTNRRARMTEAGRERKNAETRRYRARKRAEDPEAWEEKYRELKRNYPKYTSRRAGPTQTKAKYWRCRTCDLWDDCKKRGHGCSSHEQSQRLRRVGVYPPPDRERSVIPPSRVVSVDV